MHCTPIKARIINQSRVVQLYTMEIDMQLMTKLIYNQMHGEKEKKMTVPSGNQMIEPLKNNNRTPIHQTSVRSKRFWGWKSYICTGIMFILWKYGQNEHTIAKDPLLNFWICTCTQIQITVKIWNCSYKYYTVQCFCNMALQDFFLNVW